MLVLLPYTRLHPVAARLATQHAPGHVRVRLDPADPHAYWSLLARMWRQPGDLLIVEHSPALLFERLQLHAGAVARTHPARPKGSLG